VIALAPAAAPPSPAISDEVLASYKKAFSAFDKDGSGAVCVSELNEILSELAVSESKI
jgi:Ca2+-binding EF-hand superfamily protein